MKRLFSDYWKLSLVLASFLYALKSHADSHMTLRVAEELALKRSNALKAFSARAKSAEETAGAQFAPMLPLWTIDADIQYDTYIPQSTTENGESFPVGVRTPYNIGTTLSYTIWDNFSNWNAFKSSKYYADSQKETEENAKLQLLLQTRLAYLLVQLAIRELEVIGESLTQIRLQYNDISAKFKSGSVARLDLVDTRRQILSFELQYEQEKANLQLKVKDLLAILNLPTDVEVFEPVLPGDSENMEEYTKLKVHYDPIDELLKQAKQWPISRPPASQPKLQTQIFLAKSHEVQASSELAKLLPKFDVFASSQILYPDVIELQPANQNTFGITLSVPVFDGVRALHKVEASKKSAMSAIFDHDQFRIDLDRDYDKSVAYLENLKRQKEINIKDNAAAKEVAKLHFESYKAGQTLLVTVQRANLQVLTTEVQGARITATMLEQLFELQYLSGKVIL